MEETDVNGLALLTGRTYGKSIDQEDMALYNPGNESHVDIIHFIIYSALSKYSPSISPPYCTWN